MKKRLHILLFVFTALVSCVDDPLVQEKTPGINMTEPTDLKRTSVILEAVLSGPDISSVTEFGFLIGENSSLTDNKVTVRVDTIENGRFFAQIKDLQIGHTYFYAAYAANGRQTIRTPIEALTTRTKSSALLGSVEVFEKDGRIFLRSSIEDDGGATINMIGFCFDKSPNPTVYKGTVTATLGEDNTFTADVTDHLTPGEMCYIRAFVDNDILGDGTTSISYSFQTMYDVPKVDRVEIPDPIFKEYLVSICDANGDGEISPHEISSVTKLIIVTDGVTSLKGIERCTNLERLWACGTPQDAKGNGGLTELDLRMNKKLVRLECFNNKIENLYLAENNQIQYLDARVNNLKYINTFDFPELTFISLYGSLLTEVDFSKCPKLIDLTYGCDNYPARGKANLKGLTNLKNLALFHVECPDNINVLSGLESLVLHQAGLKSIDLSSFASLREFSCPVNEITELNLTHVPHLRHLEFSGNYVKSVDLSCLPDLEFLDCNSNELSDLDIRNNPKLEQLSCGHNKLSVLDISNATGLSNLYCKDNPDLHTIYVWKGFNEADYPYFYKDYQASYVVKGQGASSILSNIPDDNFRAYVLEQFDYDHDGDVTIEEAVKVTSISVKTDDIYTLEGIGCFKNLSKLSAKGTADWTVGSYFGKLTELDLSQNVSLKYVNCELNHIKTIKFHPDTKIEDLRIGYNEELIEFGKFDMSELKNIELRYTNVGVGKELDLREAVNLTSIDWGYQHSVSPRKLNIEGLTKITFMDICYLYGSYLNLESLSDLKTLYLRNSYLSKLDVSKNTNLMFLDTTGSQNLHTIYVWEGFNEADHPDFYKDDQASYVVEGQGASSILSNIPDDNFRAYVFEHFDYDHDGDVTTEEALKVESINLRTNNVYSLNGIECFKNLISLSAEGYMENAFTYQGQLTKLDLTSNTKLKYLYCSRNQIKSISLSPETSLIEFSAYANLELSSINFDSSKLEVFSIAGTAIDDMDLSDAVNLRILDCSQYSGKDEPVRNLNISGLKKITTLKAQCLKSLPDLSELADLEFLDIGISSVETLDLSANNKLSYVFISFSGLKRLTLGSNTVLSQLILPSNNLTELDISRNTSLVVLDTINNPDLHTIYVWEGFNEADYPGFYKGKATTYVVKS